MRSADPILLPPPSDPRELELWLQHGAGFILFEHVREYARAQLDPGLGTEAQAAAIKAIDDALYGLMMVIDGVPAPLQNDVQRLELEVRVRLSKRAGNIELANLDLARGDGMCMGFHAWINGDFGDQPPATYP